MKLKKPILRRCLAAALSGMLLTAVCAGSAPVTLKANAANIISNSTFDSGTSGWGVYKESGGAATLSTSEKRLALNITSVGKLNYAVQAYYDIIKLYQNGVYRLKYDISSSIERPAEGMIQQNSGTYQAYTWRALNLSPEPLSVDYTFTMMQETDIMAKMVFNCGLPKDGTELPAHTIYIDNVELELIDDSKVDYSTTKAYEPPIVTNQVGYRTSDVKIAVFREITDETTFSVVNADTEKSVFTGAITGGVENSSAGETDYFGDFSEVTTPGSYYITCGELDKSYTFTIADDVYAQLLNDTVRMLYLQRCGCAIEDDEFDHAACHTSQATIYGTNQKIDVSGGWHDAGDYGRYVVPGAKTVADMLYAYAANPKIYGDNTNIPESGNGIPDILDEVRYELEWMLKMQAETGGVYHKVTCESFPGFVLPEKETAPLIVTPVSTTATADFCASMAMAYEFYGVIDDDFAQTCLAAAEKAWAFLEKNTSLIFQNPASIVTGAYNDTNDKDERYWAAAQMYRATGEDKYLTAAETISVKKGLDWSTVGDYGSIALITMRNADTASSAFSSAKSSIISQANSFAKSSKASPYGVALTKFYWGSNMTVANAGIILATAYNLTGDSEYLTTANSNLYYLLGNNPNATCYVTGYGTVSPQNPHHRPSGAKGKAMKGMLVGGVNSSLEDSAAMAYLADAPSAKCYIDNTESYSTNEICIYWNSPLVYLLSLSESTSPGTDSLAGDVNLDESVNAADLKELQKDVLNSAELTAQQAANADVCSDKLINILDTSALKRMLISK